MKQHCNDTYKQMSYYSNAPLEHLFDNHTYCGEWGKRKKELEKMKQGESINDSRTRNVYYRRKEKDAHLYKIMKEAYACFQKKEILLQSMHLYDRHKNKT